MKVTLWMAISLNGIIATLDNREDFLSHENWDEFVKDVQKRGCLIWGRKTYEIVREWNKSYLEPLKKVTKIIISSNKNLKLDEGFTHATSPQKALDILRTKGFKDVILTGGSTTNSAFAKLGLLDDIILDIEPAILGRGIKLFADNDFYFRLSLVGVKKLPSGIIQVHYKVNE